MAGARVRCGDMSAEQLARARAVARLFWGQIPGCPHPPGCGQPEIVAGIDDLMRTQQGGWDVRGWEHENIGTYLHLAARGGHAGVAAHLVAAHGFPVNQRNLRDGNTPLHVAEYWGHAACARRLRELGADPAALNRHGETPKTVRRARGAGGRLARPPRPEHEVERDEPEGYGERGARVLRAAAAADLDCWRVGDVFGRLVLRGTAAQFAALDAALAPPPGPDAAAHDGGAAGQRREEGDAHADPHHPGPDPGDEAGAPRG